MSAAPQGAGRPPGEPTPPFRKLPLSPSASQLADEPFSTPVRRAQYFLPSYLAGCIAVAGAGAWGVEEGVGQTAVAAIAATTLGGAPAAEGAPEAESDSGHRGVRQLQIGDRVLEVDLDALAAREPAW